MREQDAAKKVLAMLEGLVGEISALKSKVEDLNNRQVVLAHELDPSLTHALIEFLGASARSQGILLEVFEDPEAFVERLASAAKAAEQVMCGTADDPLSAPDVPVNPDDMGPVQEEGESEQAFLDRKKKWADERAKAAQVPPPAETSPSNRIDLDAMRKARATREAERGTGARRR